jgi:hypothetical protein
MKLNQFSELNNLNNEVKIISKGGKKYHELKLSKEHLVRPEKKFSLIYIQNFTKNETQQSDPMIHADLVDSTNLERSKVDRA